MNQSLPFLSSETNLPEVWEANSAGRFSSAQKAIVDPLNIDREHINKEKQVANDGCVMSCFMIGFRLAIYGTFFVVPSYLWRFVEQINQVLCTGLWSALIACFIVFSIQMERELRQSAKRERELQANQLKPVPFTPSVSVTTGQIAFEMQRLTPLVKLDGLSFEIVGELWWQLREMGEQFAVYYTTLRDGRQVLLSIEPLDYPHAPSSARLATVVGIGDDGELVYADEASSATRSLGG